MNQIVSSRKILVNIGTLFSGAVIARGIGAATIVLTARWLGPNPFGRYAASLALAHILAVLLGLGLEAWLLQSGGRDSTLLGLKASASLIIQTIVVIFNLSLKLIIVQEYGLRGVAVVFVLSEALLSVGYLLYVRTWMPKIPDETLTIQPEQ